jgi:mannose-6-phosphate isomerase
MIPLTGRPRHYEWGSRTALQNMLRMPVDGTPLAEMWYGDYGLKESDEGWLGGLPFLVKLIAADRPLSLQVHPDSYLADRRFSEGHLSYGDGSAKPEILVAVTEFKALCGLRPFATTVEFLRHVNVPALRVIASRLENWPKPPDVRELFSDILSTSRKDVKWIVEDVVRAFKGIDGVGWRHERETFLRIAELYPDDPGCIISLLLNLISLKPGEAVFLAAGQIHSYLSGVGVEIMGASDNVLRAGLTSKRVDVDELLNVMSFASVTDIEQFPPSAANFGAYDCPTDAFTVRRIESNGVASISVNRLTIAVSLADWEVVLLGVSRESEALPRGTHLLVSSPSTSKET